MKAGFAKVCITPPPGSKLTGFSARQAPSTGVHDDLYARALVLSRGDRTVALLSVEVLALGAETVQVIRQRVAATIPVQPAEVLVAATHTHSGPVTLSTFFNADEKPDPEYLEFLIQACTQSVVTAWNTKFAAKLGIGSCMVEGVGVNRRDPGNPRVDRQAGILRVAGDDGRTLAVAVIYGCHPTVLGFTNLQVSGDFPGAALEELETALGAESFAMFFNGAEANVSIAHSAELNLAGISTGDRTFEQVRILGHRLAQAVLSVLPAIQLSTDPALDAATVTIPLAGRQYPQPEVLDAAWQDAREKCAMLPPGDPELRIAQMRQVYSAIDRTNARTIQENGGRLPIEIQGIRLNGALLLGISGEVFTETSLALKALLPKPVFVICLANGYAGYLPTAEAFTQGGYEASVAGCAPDTEEKILAAALQISKLVSA